MGRFGPPAISEQPSQKPPRRETKRKIRQLAELRKEIERLKVNVRVAPTRDMERELQQLIRRESDLSADVGFGDS
jgi:hypothetical protein